MKVRPKPSFFHQNVYSFWIWPARTFSERYWKNASIKTYWGSLEQIGTNLWFLEKVIYHKISWSWRKSGFYSPKSSVGSILAVQNTFLNNLLAFGWVYTLLAQDWCTGYQAMSSSLKGYAGNAPLNQKSMPIPSHRYMLTHRLHINHQKCWLDIHPAPRRRCYTKRL